MTTKRVVLRDRFWSDSEMNKYSMQIKQSNNANVKKMSFADLS